MFFQKFISSETAKQLPLRAYISLRGSLASIGKPLTDEGVYLSETEWANLPPIIAMSLEVMNRSLPSVSIAPPVLSTSPLFPRTPVPVRPPPTPQSSQKPTSPPPPHPGPSVVPIPAPTAPLPPALPGNRGPSSGPSLQSPPRSPTHLPDLPVIPLDPPKDDPVLVVWIINDGPNASVDFLETCRLSNLDKYVKTSLPPSGFLARSKSIPGRAITFGEIVYPKGAAICGFCDLPALKNFQCDSCKGRFCLSHRKDDGPVMFYSKHGALLGSYPPEIIRSVLCEACHARAPETTDEKSSSSQKRKEPEDDESDVEGSLIPGSYEYDVRRYMAKKMGKLSEFEERWGKGPQKSPQKRKNDDQKETEDEEDESEQDKRGTKKQKTTLEPLPRRPVGRPPKSNLVHPKMEGIAQLIYDSLVAHANIPVDKQELSKRVLRNPMNRWGRDTIRKAIPPLVRSGLLGCVDNGKLVGDYVKRAPVRILLQSEFDHFHP